MKTLLLLLCGLAASLTAHAQVGIGTPTPAAGAALEIKAADKGLLIPRLTAAQRTAIASPPQGLMVYQTEAPEGFYYFGGSPGAWVYLNPSAGAALTLPYSGTASTTSNVFAVTNTSSGAGLRGASASGQGVVGRVNGTGPGQGVVGVKGTSVPNIEDAGVVGLSDADYGVYARSTQQSGVVGISDGTSPTAAGVQGSATGAALGVYGVSSANSGVYGVSNANNVSVAGVQGVGNGGSGAVGVLGQTTSGYGVRGVATAPNGYGVNGVAVGSNGYGVIGSGSSGAAGVYGSASDNGRAGYFTQTSATSTVPAVEISQAGTGPALRLNGKVNTPTTGSANMLPAAYGRVAIIYDASGHVTGATKTNGTSNWTLKRLGVGDYLITFTSPDLATVPASQLVIQATAVQYGGDVINIIPDDFLPKGQVEIFIVTPLGNQAFVENDDDFSFIVYKP